MEKFEIKRDEAGNAVVEVAQRGRELLSHAMYNKGSAFTLEEREQFRLRGLLPPVVSEVEIQTERAYCNIMRKDDPLERYIGLAALQDRNEVLFYKVMHDHLEELAPIVYTPTVGKACQQFSHIFRRGRGLWITPADRGSIEKVLSSAPYGDVDLIVVTDNERILGLGDQGAGGMGIPIGKLVLYTVGAGIHPSRVLPISLDVGTDNDDLRADPLYLGHRAKRLRGPEYDSLVEEFVEAVKKCFPNVLLQWEDFKKQNAFDLLDRYRERLLSFNDDIQGTAAVTLAGILAATRVTGVSMAQQRVVILGAGAAGVGIGRQIRDAVKRAGASDEEVARSVALLDSKGLLTEGRPTRDAYKKEFAWSHELIRSIGLEPEDNNHLLAVIQAIKPTVLVGASGQPNTIIAPMVREMAKHVERPVIMPFSNPTDRCEVQPADAIQWTDGRALVASGSPFEPVEHGGRRIRIGQGNNVFIFPGVGLGALVAGARYVTDSMFTVAAQTLADHVDQADLDEGALYPPLAELREVSAKIAAAVAVEAAEAGVADPIDLVDARERVAERMWKPVYPKMVPV